MSEIALLPEERLGARIARDGFVFVEAAAMESALARAGSLGDWPAFAASWERLELDTYMADGGRYRRRRHAVYGAAAEGAILRRPHQPHYQSRDYNPLNGGIARWFAPIAPEIGRGPSMRAILGFCSTLFGSLAPATSAWHIEAHQFRIEARLGEEGRPTPEGLHRDGVDYVLVLLIARRNIKRGTTTIHDLEPPPARQLHARAPLRCGPRRRRARLSRCHAGRAARSRPTRLSRRARGDVPRRRRPEVRQVADQFRHVLRDAAFGGSSG